MRSLHLPISRSAGVFSAIGIIIITALMVTAYNAWHQSWTIKPEYTPVVTLNTFNQTVGYKLGYDLFMPNSFTGWTPNPKNKLHFNSLTNTYEIYGVNVAKTQVDDWGARFKITSIDWQNEFGVAVAEATNEQSKFGIPLEGAIVHLTHYVDSRDIYFELPKAVAAKALNVKVKITSQDFHPTALLYVTLVE
ncbi:hypothetical protein [uncultured Gilvimarinus sp.]|uniref:hypothetical protein n=1 Tax=uncultured Gilvimarinus sp. TaxID=1689143 RepID=UPI0030D6E240